MGSSPAGDGCQLGWALSIQLICFIFITSSPFYPKSLWCIIYMPRRHIEFWPDTSIRYCLSKDIVYQKLTITTFVSGTSKLNKSFGFDFSKEQMYLIKVKTPTDEQVAKWFWFSSQMSPTYIKSLSFFMFNIKDSCIFNHQHGKSWVFVLAKCYL